jgi:hypothetical protein
MAEGISSAHADNVLNAIFNATSYSVSAIWLQLHTAAPGAAGTTAIAGNATRKDITSSMATASGGTCSSNVDIVWSSGEVDTSEDYTHWSLWTLVSAGVFICSGTVTANAVTVGDTFTIPSGDLDITMAIAS